MNWQIADDIVPIILIISVFTFLIVSSITYYGYKSYCFGRLSSLKEKLLDAGMTSAEIERIVNAGTKEFSEPIQQKKIA